MFLWKITFTPEMPGRILIEHSAAAGGSPTKERLQWNIICMVSWLSFARKR